MDKRQGALACHGNLEYFKLYSHRIKIGQSVRVVCAVYRLCIQCSKYFHFLLALSPSLHEIDVWGRAILTYFIFSFHSIPVQTPFIVAHSLDCAGLSIATDKNRCSCLSILPTPPPPPPHRHLLCNDNRNEKCRTGSVGMHVLNELMVRRLPSSSSSSSFPPVLTKTEGDSRTLIQLVLGL